VPNVDPSKPSSGDGPLPTLLLALTFNTGLVDAYSYLVLGHVFVANMTGNVVFLGFAAAGASGFSIAASGVALLSFGLGAAIGGRILAQLVPHRGRLLALSSTIQVLLLSVSVVLTLLSGNRITSGYQYPLIIALSMAMGIQNANVRKLAVADLTTTVLTLTITGIAADSARADGKGPRVARRILSVILMLGGALLGAELIIHVRIIYPLLLCLVVSLAVAAFAQTLGKSNASWTSARK
jgi:uncharacterized membrane protein YoaK (UPF0700 family)